MEEVELVEWDGDGCMNGLTNVAAEAEARRLYDGIIWMR